MKIRIVSYNIHKGIFRPVGRWRKRVTIHGLREQLRKFNADLIFLQEVQGMHRKRAAQNMDWPMLPHYEFLAQNSSWHLVYGQNLVNSRGDHGNVLLSQFSILQSENIDISDHVLEARGLLHCVVDMRGLAVHCFAVHFGLFARGRQRQSAALIERIRSHVPSEAPLLIAGDFNDWNNRLSQELHKTLGVSEVFNEFPARSFPSLLPILRLDRVYQRGFSVRKAEVLRGAPWRNLSDHSPLVVDLERIA